MAQQNFSFIRPYEVVEGDSTKVKYRGYNGTQELEVGVNVESDTTEIINDVFVPNEGGNVVFTDENETTHELVTAGNLAKEVETLKKSIEDVLDAIASGSFYNGVPTLSWASTKYDVTLTLTKCSADNTDARTSGKYETTLTPDSGYEFGDSAISVTMGGDDITDTALSGAKVSIAEVTGAIVIVATATAVNNG
ncbi:MAG: hypothetical protein IK100_09455 [Muribaculaceae bacterium]|nr:hypothetical protein [Muribaculaceae bacterium]